MAGFVTRLEVLHLSGMATRDPLRKARQLREIVDWSNAGKIKTGVGSGCFNESGEFGGLVHRTTRLYYLELCVPAGDLGRGQKRLIRPASSLLRCSTYGRGCPTPGCLQEWSASGFRFSGGLIGQFVLPGSGGLPESFSLRGGWCCGLRRNRLRQFPRARR